MRNLDEVKVGDKLIYRRSGIYNSSSILEVAKVTDTQLTCTNGDRYMKSTGIKVGMRDSWSVGSVWKATEKDIESVRVQERLRKAKNGIKDVAVTEKNLELIEKFLVSLALSKERP